MGISELECAIVKLKSTLKAIDKQETFIGADAHAIDAVAAKLNIPVNLKTFYSIGAPSNVAIEVGAFYLNLYSVEKLWDRQSGYRWNAHDPSQAVMSGWDKDWTVIADMSCDPIIMGFGDNRNAIYMSMHGIGAWKFKVIAPDILAFLRVINAWIEIYHLKYHRIDSDENCEPLPEFKNDLRAAWAKIIDETCLNNLWELSN